MHAAITYVTQMFELPGFDAWNGGFNMGLQLILSVRKEAPLRSPSLFNHRLSTILVVIITRLQMPLLKPFDQERPIQVSRSQTSFGTVSSGIRSRLLA